MTIKFSPFARIMEKRIKNDTKYVISLEKENPYYRNLAGLYGVFDTPMTVLATETGTRVPFDRALWDDYPKTASLYTYGSEAHHRLCLEYPNQTGLIKNIMYPVPDIDEAVDAPELTILRHAPEFLRTNEREDIYQSCKKCLEYIRDRWFIMDYCCEDQYPLVFMSKVYLLLFISIMKQRQVNRDTHAVHHMHVWDRLIANGLGPYESLLTDSQARWFYRNMRYLKENRGRKSNLILLADNLLKNLKVHLVGKRIFQQTQDPLNEVVMVPEFLSEEIVDYSVPIPESLITTTNNGLPVIPELDSTLSADLLVNKGSKEEMDTILYRVHGEGYYPNYSLPDSIDKEVQFGKTVTNTLPTRLLEFQKYTINTQYLRHLTVFLFDSLMYQYSLGNLQYKITFKDDQTSLPVTLTAGDALILMHYLVYKKDDITPVYLPELHPVDSAYKKERLDKKDIPVDFWWMGYKYRLDTLVDVKGILDEIPWINEKFYDAGDFIRALGYQFDKMVGHLRDVATRPLLIYQWAMWYFYQHILARETVSLKVSNKTYAQWFAQNEVASTLIDAYEELPEKRLRYQNLGQVLLRKILPIEKSNTLLPYAGAIYDNTLFYQQIKQLFTDWTSHDLTYLDTDRTEVTYLNLYPIGIMTSDGSDNSDVQINEIGLDVVSDEHVVLPIDLRDEDSTKPTLNEVTHTETSYHDDTTSIVVIGDTILEELSDIGFYDNQACLSSDQTEIAEIDIQSFSSPYQLFDGIVNMSTFCTGIQLVDASQPD